MTHINNNIKNYFSHQQNAFLNPNLRTLLMKTITSIITGQKMKQNQHRLHQLRTQPQYPLILCQLLTTLHKTTLMQQSIIQTNKKDFLLLEIKKNIQRLKNQQCWWLLRDVYFSDNDKTAKMIRQICLMFQKQQSQNNNNDVDVNNYLSIFFIVNLENLGLVGVVRYLMLVHNLVSCQFKNLENKAIIKYGQVIVKKILETLEWDLPGYVIEFALTCLIMLQGFLVGRQCWADTKRWNNVLTNVLQSQQQKPLLNCLSRYLMSQLNLIVTSNIENNKQKQQQQLLQSIKHCLSQTRQHQIQSLPEKLFFVDCLSILNQEWRRDIKMLINKGLLKDNLQHIYRVIEVYKIQFTQGLDKEKKWLNNYYNDNEDDQYQDTQNIIVRQKRCSILISTFQLIPHDELLNIILQKDSYLLLFMHLSTHCQSLKKYGSIDVDGCFNLLSCALREESDMYLFYKEKGELVDVVIRYVAKYYKLFQPDLLLKSSYLLDLLAHKCDTIAQQCYQLLTIFSQQLQNCYTSQLIQFLETSLEHINENQWQQTANCYTHIIRLIVGIDPGVIFSVNSNNNINKKYNDNYIQFQCQQQQHEQQHRPRSLFSSFQSTANPMQKHILQMVKNIITSLQNSFDYEQMHSLNKILQYLLNHAPHICHELTYKNFTFITKTNFTYQILTTESADVYFYYTQFSQQKHIFINSVNLYQFWQLCQSQKLQFFVHVYLKLIHPSSKFFTSSQIDHKLNQLKKNLWHRFVSQKDQDERQKIQAVFYKHPEEFNSLFEEFHRITLWGEIKNQYHSPLRDRENGYQMYCAPKMEFQ